jgi:hypothetical protein
MRIRGDFEREIEYPDAEIHAQRMNIIIQKASDPKK